MEIGQGDDKRLLRCARNDEGIGYFDARKELFLQKYNTQWRNGQRDRIRPAMKGLGLGLAPAQITLAAAAIDGRIAVKQLAP